MQQLIHDALLHEQSGCDGFLAGSGFMIESAITGSASEADIASLGLKGIYQATDTRGQLDRAKSVILQRRFECLTGSTPDYFMLLQCGNKGRVDALLFADADQQQPLELDMQEDGDLYPVPASR